MARPSRSSGNRPSSPFSASTWAASIPAAAQLASCPASPRSNTLTCCPARARYQPMARPQIPPPTIAVMTHPFFPPECGHGDTGRVKTGAWGKNPTWRSLRWHHPVQVHGYNLRPGQTAPGHPSPRVPPRWAYGDVESSRPCRRYFDYSLSAPVAHSGRRGFYSGFLFGTFVCFLIFLCRSSRRYCIRVDQ